MKVCPRCQKTYTDDNLNFCLDDGVVLQQTGSSEAPPTVFMNQPASTNPQPMVQPPPTMQSQQPAWNTAPQQQYGGPPKKSSKAWIWVLLILGVVVIGCGTLSVVGIILINKSADTTAANNTATSNTKPIANTKTSSNTTASNATTTFPSNTSSTTSTTDGRSDVEDIELQKWVKDNSIVGNTEFTGGEFIMSSKQKGYYYVLVAPDNYTTDGANVRVSLRNIDNMDSRYGYGLIFHSNPEPLNQDYAFLIDTKKKKYRVVHHVPSGELPVIQWTSSNAIKDGTQENDLEARDRPDDRKVDLYINGQLVNTIPNTYGYKNGVPGLYAGDAAKIAFKNLQLVK
jgi:hypothetical protein